MWIYLENEPDEPGYRVSFVKGKKGFRMPVYYDATCRMLVESFPNADGIVVPDFVSGLKYEVWLLLLQLRLEKTKCLHLLPIKIRFFDEDRYYRFCDKFEVTDQSLRNIGVVLIPPDKMPGWITSVAPKDIAVQEFLAKELSRPKFTEGRHDQANRWSPYVFLRVLEQVDPSLATRRESVEKGMFEEPYLKRLANDIRDKLPKKMLDALRSERSWLQNKLFDHQFERKILVVEDRLEEGWRDVYEVMFDSKHPRMSLLWAVSVDEAIERFSKEIALIVLDVRLNPKDEQMATGSSYIPTGVILAQQFRRESPTIPILAATASNKTWILEPLLREGIQGYWVKESPEQAVNLRLAAQNVLDLFQKTRVILEWSDRTRPWIEGLYSIARQVQDSDLRQGKILNDKAKSLHALLDRAFSPFSRELDDGLQLNVAFLILFSCMNDLRVWCCKVVDLGDGEKDWLLVNDLGSGLLLSKRKKGMRKGQPFYSFECAGRQSSSEHFPDTDASLELMMQLGLVEKARIFRKLKNNVRNALPLTHGLSDAKTRTGTDAVNASDLDLSEMLGILQAVVNSRFDFSNEQLSKNLLD